MQSNAQQKASPNRMTSRRVFPSGAVENRRWKVVKPYGVKRRIAILKMAYFYKLCILFLGIEN